MKKRCIICKKEHENPFPYCSNECWKEHRQKNNKLEANNNSKKLYLYKRYVCGSSYVSVTPHWHTIKNKNNEEMFKVGDISIPLDCVFTLHIEDRLAIEKITNDINNLIKEKNKIMENIFNKYKRQNNE